jgi:hypothetical protein
MELPRRPQNCAISLFIATSAGVLLLVAGDIGAQNHSEADKAAPASFALPDSEIDDEFFAFAVGLLINDIAATFGLETFLEAFPIYRDMPSETPIKKLQQFRRSRIGRDSPESLRENHESPAGARREERRALLTVSFVEPLEYPVPVDFLGYHPGDVETSQRIALIERAYAERIVPSNRGDSVLLSPLYVLEITEGRLVIDFDALVDRLLFGALDDLDARMILLFRHNGAWFAMLTGEGHRERIHAWTFNLATTEFMRRPPRRLRGIAEYLLAPEEEQGR